MMLFDLLLLAVGLATIYFGGRYLVDGASSIALKLGMPPVIIGVTVVAMGTSAPELFLGTISAAEGVPGVSIGNVVGANVAIVTVVIGVCAVISPIVSRFEEVRRESYAAVLAAVLFLVFALDRSIDYWEGMIMLGSFAIYLYWVICCMRGCRVPREIETEYDELAEAKPLWLASLTLLGGIAALMMGAQLTIDGAIKIASDFGMSEILIGATVVSIGTVMPEMSVSVIAALKKQQDIAIGNVFGTIVFNSLVVTGSTSVISKITFSGTTVFPGLAFTIAFTLALTVILLRRSGLSRNGGLVLIACYGAFIMTLFLLNAL